MSPRHQSRAVSARLRPCIPLKPSSSLNAPLFQIPTSPRLTSRRKATRRSSSEKGYSGCSNGLLPSGGGTSSGDVVAGERLDGTGCVAQYSAYTVWNTPLA
jgi:hypothetical protein